jgi:hypothetical protein
MVVPGVRSNKSSTSEKIADPESYWFAAYWKAVSLILAKFMLTLNSVASPIAREGKLDQV